MNHIELLGVNIATVKPSEIQSLLADFLQHTGLKQIVTVNPEFLVTAHEDNDFKAILNAADLALPDGVGIIYVGKLLRKQISLTNRMTGVEVTHSLLKLAEAQQKSVEIVLPDNSLSSDEKILDSVKKLYPQSIVRVIKVSDIKEQSPRADIIFVALGAPQQEKWIWEHREKLLGTKIAVGVGGTFDFISGKISRAPHWMRSIGLEWLWRLYKEPRRRFRRIIRAVIVFPFLVLSTRSSKF
jgi:N-acetylglucosaminyldiphosphoundecaprenol N-acetyl-beta-D-mannosaminyltransferase